MSWAVAIADEFEPEFDSLHMDVQTEVLALARLLQQFGPQLGRPRADTLYRTLIRKADERFDRHLTRVAQEGDS